jgi:DNA replication protein
MSFSGFGRGILFTPVPNPLFGPLLEQIQDLAEFKVTLRSMWLLHRKRGRPQVAHLNEFLNDPALLRGLKGPGKVPREEIRRGLELTVARGTLLMHRPDEDNESSRVYLLNTDAGRSVMARLRQGEEIGRTEDGVGYQGQEEEPPEEKPNIFALYEDNVGTLSPMLAEQLKEVESTYPGDWVINAFQIAVAENKRNWHYIAGILRRWAAEGKDHGKPGRHSSKDNRQKYLADYERRWSSSTEQRSRR